MNIDIAIFVGFLIINLTLGIYYGRNIKDIKEYAIGNRNFSTAAIAATIVATWISGSDFAVAVSESYKEGLWYLVAGTGDIIALLIIGHVFAPRMKEFFGNLSVAESMGNMYGLNIRIVTAVASIGQAIGQIALQIKIFSTIFGHFLGFSSIYATLISSFVVIIYSSIGGIRSVTFTDIIQFFAFGVFVPIFALFIWQIFGNTDLTIEAFHNNPLFDYTQLFDYKGIKFWPYFFLLLYFSIPSLNSTMFQRTLMARDTKQIRQSFSIAALSTFIIHILSCFIGLTVLSYTADLEPNSIVMHVIDTYAFTGLKGIALVAIMAMVMSTADSWINTASVIFAHDLCKPLSLKAKNELIFSRLFSLFIGTSAILLALKATDLLKLLLLSANFYKPIVTISLILAILGFRSSTRAVGIGMFAGGLAVIVWKTYITPITGIDSVVPSMFINLVSYVGAHYLLKEPGGWVGVKDKSDLNEIRNFRRGKFNTIKKFFNYIPTLGFLEYFNLRIPKNEITYTYFAFGTLLTMVVSFCIEKTLYHQHTVLINILEGIALFISAIFIGHNLFWPTKFKVKYIGLIWHIAIFITLAFISSFLVLISKFSQISLVVLVLNYTMIGMLLSWQVAFTMIVIGVSLALYCYQLYIGVAPELSLEVYDLKLKITSILFMVCGFMLTFLKSQQDQQKLTEEKNKHLNGLINTQEVELHHALNLKTEFIRNVTHEYHTPMTGIMSNAETLWEVYDKLDDKSRRSAVHDIYTSSIRLKDFDENIRILARLNKAGYTLQKKILNLSTLVHDSVQTCRKLYEDDKGSREFILNIEENITFEGDEYYLMQAIDNLITNSIRYCSEGKVNIILKQDKGKIVFTISDEGIGIPREELYTIFEHFTVSSKTRTPAGGRGLGLTVCKRIIELHGGEITAESDGVKGANFYIVFDQ